MMSMLSQKLSVRPKHLSKMLSIRGMNWFEVISTRGYIEDGAVTYYQVTIEFGFKFDK